MTPRAQMLEGRPSPASYSYRDQGSDFCKKQSTRQRFPISEGSESVRSAPPLLRREDSLSRGIQNVGPPQGTPSTFQLSENTRLGGLTEHTRPNLSCRGLPVAVQCRAMPGCSEGSSTFRETRSSPSAVVITETSPCLLLTRKHKQV